MRVLKAHSEWFCIWLINTINFFLVRLDRVENGVEDEDDEEQDEEEEEEEDDEWKGFYKKTVVHLNIFFLMLLWRVTYCEN